MCVTDVLMCVRTRRPPLADLLVTLERAPGASLAALKRSFFFFGFLAAASAFVASAVLACRRVTKSHFWQDGLAATCRDARHN